MGNDLNGYFSKLQGSIIHLRLRSFKFQFCTLQIPNNKVRIDEMYPLLRQREIQYRVARTLETRSYENSMCVPVNGNM